ncbi:MAG TPA: ABC transporter substrate-binding protein [Chloroflexota bacterium]|nr:ABC transporter substrate-binding protein [Chloroflexota bacterium]
MERESWSGGPSAGPAGAPVEGRRRAVTRRRRWLMALAGAGAGGGVMALAGCGPSAAGPGTATPGAGTARDGRGATPASGGATQGGTAPAQSTGGAREVVIAVSRDLANGPQDPFFAHSSPMVWEPLVGLDDALRPRGVLAESWDLSDDGKTWTFKLRRGVTFSDGTPFDADAVVANIQRYIKISPRPSPYTAMDIRVGYGQLADVRKIDAQTVAMMSEEPNPTMVSTMSNFFSAMFQPALFAENGDFTGLPVTTGPFKLVDWRRGEYLLLERNEGYWGPKPAVQRIRLRTILDANARVSSLLAREVDAIAELGAILPAQAQQLKGQPGITVGADPISITQYLVFNCAKAPFDDVRVRRAVAMAVDRETIARQLVEGYATPGRSLLSPLSTTWFSPKGTPRYAPTEARDLARAALGGQPVELVLPFSTSAGQARPYKAIGELLQAVLRPLGFEIRLQGLEGAALTDAVNRGEWNLYFAQLGWANGDPDFIFSRYMKSNAVLTGTARIGYANGEVDDLIAAGKLERDERRRFAIYERLQELSVQEMPVLVLYHELAPYAYRDTISGLKQRANFQPTLDTLKVK